MADLSYEQYVAKHGTQGDVRKTEEAYKAVVKQLAGKNSNDADYQKLRDAKADAGKNMSLARQEAEAKFYAEPIAKMKEDIAKREAATAAGAAK